MTTPSTPLTPITPFAPFSDRTAGLAHAAAQGDTLAMLELLRALAPKIERVVRAIAGKDDADRAAEQAMLELVQKLPAYRGECAPEHFASRIAARAAIAARRCRRLDAREAYVEQPTEAAALPLAEIERRRRLATTRDALAQIPLSVERTSHAQRGGRCWPPSLTLPTPSTRAHAPTGPACFEIPARVPIAPRSRDRQRRDVDDHARLGDSRSATDPTPSRRRRDRERRSRPAPD